MVSVAKYTHSGALLLTDLVISSKFLILGWDLQEVDSDKV